MQKKIKETSIRSELKNALLKNPKKALISLALKWKGNKEIKKWKAIKKKNIADLVLDSLGL